MKNALETIMWLGFTCLIIAVGIMSLMAELGWRW
jgi:hypothetical protein